MAVFSQPAETVKKHSTALTLDHLIHSSLAAKETLRREKTAKRLGSFRLQKWLDAANNKFELWYISFPSSSSKPLAASVPIWIWCKLLQDKKRENKQLLKKRVLPAHSSQLALLNLLDQILILGLNFKQRECSNNNEKWPPVLFNFWKDTRV